MKLCVVAEFINGLSRRAIGIDRDSAIAAFRAEWPDRNPTAIVEGRGWYDPEAGSPRTDPAESAHHGKWVAVPEAVYAAIRDEWMAEQKRREEARRAEPAPAPLEWDEDGNLKGEEN